jgi:UDP-N-acetylmuramoylalanine--D-glutamate ligase
MIVTASNTVNNIDAHRTLIVGLGKTGLSCARFLALRGDSFVITDSRTNPPGLDELLSFAPHVECYLGGFDEFVFSQAEKMIVSPGVSVKQALISDAAAKGVEIIGDIELFARSADAPIIVITGSNGKSTVTTLLGEMAQNAGKNVRVGGNLGTPALDLLFEPATSGKSAGSSKKVDFYILEVSSFQLETTHSLHAHAAVVLNISADHMDRYMSLREYTAAKQKVYNGCNSCVVNRDDETVMRMVTAGTKPTVSFGLGVPDRGQFGLRYQNKEAWLARGEELLLPAGEVLIPGMHNLSNALAALALGESMGLPMLSMLSTLRTFAGLPHRMQHVATIGGIQWFNDSKGTNVGATVSALLGMPGPKILIAGGDGKGADFTPLREVVIANNVRAVVLIGRDAPLIEKALKGVVKIQHANDMTAAVKTARAVANAGDSVILSPACASFDMFNNFQHRGDVFTAAVKELNA